MNFFINPSKETKLKHMADHSEESYNSEDSLDEHVYKK